MKEKEHDGAVKRRARPGRKARALEQTKQRHDAFTVGLLSGCAAGLTVNMCLFPLNTVKTRLQARTVGSAWRSPTLFKGLYRGFVIDTLGCIPGTGLFMATYELIKSTRAVHMTLGAAGAAAAASLLTAPCDAIKQRLQVNSSRTLRGELTKVFRSPKPLATLFVGYPQYLMRDLPFDAIQMSSFEMLRCWHTAVVEPGRERTAGENAMLGGVAGAVTGFVTTPLDVARTAEVCALSAGMECKGTACLFELVKRGGSGVLFRGSVPRMIEISVGGVLYFSAMAATKKALGWVDEVDADNNKEKEKKKDNGGTTDGRRPSS